MTKTAFLAVASAAVLLPSIAHADEPSPSLGIGLTQTLGGTHGLAVRYGRSVQLELVAGGSHVGDWDREGQGRLSAAARVHVPLLRFDDGWIGAVAGLDVHQSRYGADASDTEYWGVVEGGLHAEYFLVPALSIGLEVGAAWGRALGDYEVLYGSSGAIGIGPWSGAASLTYWVDAPPAAERRDDGTHLGVGMSQTIGGPRLTLSADLGRPRIELYGGVGRNHADGSTSMRTTVGAGLLYEVARRGPAALLVGARVAGVRVADENRTDWSFEGELPVRLELDAASWLTLHVEGGPSIDTQLGGGTELGRSEIRSGVGGALGFTVWH